MLAEFSKLILHNFMSYQHAELDLSSPGLLLLDGCNQSGGSFSSNGAGKSALAEAVFWCLYGKTLRKTMIDGVVNDFEAKDCHVEIDMRLGRDAVKIKRFRNHKTLGNAFTVQVNDCVHAKDEAVKALAQIFPMSEEVFTNLVYVGRSDKYSPFHLLDDGGKKAILQCIYPQLEVLDAVHAKVLTEMKANSAALGSWQGQKEAYSRMLEDLDRQIASILKNQAQDAEARRMRAEALHQTHAKMQIELQELQAKLASAKAACAVNEHELYVSAKDIKGKLSDMGMRIGGCQAQQAQCRHAISKLESQLRALPEAKICPLCGSSDIDPEKIKAKLELELTEQESILPELDASLATLRMTHKLYTHRLERTEEMLKILSMISGQEAQIKAQQTRAACLLEEIKLLQTNSQHVRELKPMQDNRASIAAKLDAVCKDISKMDYRQKVLDVQNKMTADNGISALIIDSALAGIERQANDMLGEISGGDIEIGVDVSGNELRKRKGAISITAKNANGSYVYGGNSSGEKARIDICMLFGLIKTVSAMTGLSSNLLFVDELLDALDDTGVEGVIHLLNNIDFRDKRILIASHNKYLKESVPDKITILKKSRFSEIVA